MNKKDQEALDNFNRFKESRSKKEEVKPVVVGSEYAIEKKAKQLVNQFKTKQYAIACCNQILDLPVIWFSKESSDRDDEVYPHSATEEFWQSVKEKIKTL